MAAGVSRMASSPTRFCTSRTRMVTTWAMCSLASGWKTMMSSIRFRNSGLNVRWISSLILSCILSNEVLKSCPWKPSVLPCMMSRAPTFEVMMTTVFLKSITRP